MTRGPPAYPSRQYSTNARTLDVSVEEVKRRRERVNFEGLIDLLTCGPFEV
jgi:hypothetical protein